MDTYMKRFVFASLFYLGLAAVFGILNGLTDIGYVGLFAHSHFNLLGFMAMIVFGIGYFILPRFNGTTLRWPGWVPIHFWIGNFSLLGMVLFRGLESETGAGWAHVLFIIMAAVQVASLFMFIINIWVTLSPRKQTASVDSQTAPVAADAPPAPPAPPAIVVDEETSIAALIDRVPTVQQVLVDQGLKMLGVPGHLDKVRKVGVTLGMAANNHGLDSDELIAAVGAEIARADRNRTPATRATAPDFSSDTLIGAVMEQHPKTKVIFERYFGDGCLDCPGQSYESIDMACRMHGVDPETFIEELQAAAAEPSVG